MGGMISGSSQTLPEIYGGKFRLAESAFETTVASADSPLNRLSAAAVITGSRSLAGRQA